jgi:hypothetical protein
MANEPIWTFYGFCSAAGNRLVQEWFDVCDQELKDEIIDSLRYHENVERHLWKRPGFDELGGEGISEFRFKAIGTWWRIYGDYGPKRHEYTFLHGDEKKVGNDKAGKQIAKERKKLLAQGKASVHEFRWKEDPD